MAGRFLLDGLVSRAGWIIAVLVAVAIAMPILNTLPADNPLYVPTYLLPVWGKYICYALLAVALNLVWGYAGILSLGHAAFFALGGYAMGMYLMRQIGARGQYANPILPDFMVFLNWDELPWYWHGFDQFWFAALMVVLVPGALAFVFGWLAFRSRVSGVYLSIITQALTYALGLAFFRNEMGFGGNNGLTGFRDILGEPIAQRDTRVWLFVASLLALAIGVWLVASIMKSKFGKVMVAIRDAESRTRFIGYRVEGYKLVVWTLSAVMAGIAGALYVPQVLIINPEEFGPARSIEAVIWVAVGGRGTFVGPILGAIGVSSFKTFFTGSSIISLGTLSVLPVVALLVFLWVHRRGRDLPLLGAGVLAGAAAAAALYFVAGGADPGGPGGFGTASKLGLGLAGVLGLVWAVVYTRPVLAGAALGAAFVMLRLNAEAPFALASYWFFMLGGLFVLVTLLLPKGIAGTIAMGWNALRQRRNSRNAQSGIDPPPPAADRAPPGATLTPALNPTPAE